MTHETPFVKERLIKARESAGISISSLARLISVVRQTAGNYETGATTPKPDMVARIAEVLQVPVGYFYSPTADTGYTHDAVFFRDNASNRRTDQHAAGRALEAVEEYVLLVLQYVDFPELQFIHPTMPDDPRQILEERIESTAQELREAWGLGSRPIRNLTSIAELNGVIIRKFTIGNDHLDALSMWSSAFNRPLIVLNDEKSNCVRSRFDLAHELGHMILHRNVPAHFRSEPSTYKILERQAHRFASSLLLPRSSWPAEVATPTLGTFQSLKPKWLASIAAQVRRALDLELVGPERYQSLMRQMSVRKWRKREPLDTSLPAEDPSLIRKATELIASSSTRGLGAIVDRVPQNPGILSRYAGVPPEFFDPADQLARTMKTRDRSGLVN